MSELIPPQQQLAAAISQLSQSSSSTRLASEAVGVIVRQITGNQLVLASGSREITLPRQQLVGELRTGQNYQTVLTQNTNTRPSSEERVATPPQALRFFTQSNLSLDIPLNNNQSQSLVTNLPNTVLRQITNAAQVINGRVLQVTPNLLIVELNNLLAPNVPPNGATSNQLTLVTSGTTQSFAPNQPIQLRLTTENNQLNVSISTSKAVQRLPLNLPLLAETSGVLTQTTEIISRFVQRPISTSLQEVVPALRNAITYSPSDGSRSSNNNDPRRSFNPNTQSSPNQTIAARLSFGTTGISVATNANVEQATFEQVTPQQLRQLRTLSIPVLNTNANQAQVNLTSGSPDTPSTDSSTIAESAATTLPPADETEREAFLRQVVSSGNRQALLSQVQSLIRQTRPLTESPSAILNRIETALSDLAQSAVPELTKLTNEVKEQLTQSLPGNNTQSSEAIRQLLSGTPANITNTLTRPQLSGNGLVSGLIGLLQITLASRLNQSNARTLDRITQALSPIFTSGIAPKNVRQQVSRSLADVSQLDQKYLLLRELGKFFASHQNYKLSSVEQQLNSQDGLYYVLPSAQDGHRKDIELLIKRQQDNESEEKKQVTASRAWQVSMKLDIGDKGQLLAKAKLNEKDVEVDFYASNTELKSLVFNFIPQLKDRLQSFGVQIAKHQCQLGKIPESLQRRPYQILETRA